MSPQRSLSASYMPASSMPALSESASSMPASARSTSSLSVSPLSAEAESRPFISAQGSPRGSSWRPRRARRASSFVSVVLAAALVAACGSDSEPATEGSGSIERVDPDAVAAAEVDGTNVRLVTHDSFLVSDGIWDTFTEQTGITVDVIAGGDAGEVVARAVLSSGNPEADVLFGIDNTFLQRGLDADLFIAYDSPELTHVDPDLDLDPEHRVVPIDTGDVCVNYSIEAFGADAPTSLEDLARPEFAGAFVTPNPESSSPGFAFLLATVSHFGEDGWEAFWENLMEGGATITAGWSDAYYGQFVAGGGPKTLVTSYAASPVAELVFAEEPLDAPTTAVMPEACFRQIEFAGILAGTDHPEAAAMLIDFLLGPEFQEDIPLNMFVRPARGDVALPDVFVEHGVDITDPYTLDPADIEANRAQWTDRWAEIVAG